MNIVPSFSFLPSPGVNRVYSSWAGFEAVAVSGVDIFLNLIQSNE